MNSLVSKLHEIVIELVSKHYMTHEQIKKEIFNAILSLSKDLPKIQVLYNDCHGGRFSFDCYFYEFMESNIVNQYISDERLQRRIDYVSVIEKYGMFCKQKYPTIEKMIKIYKKYEIDNVISKQSLINMINEYIKTVESKPDDFFQNIESNVIISNYYMFNVSRYKQYSKQSLLDTLNSQIKIQKEYISNNIFNNKLLDLLQDYCNLNKTTNKEQLDTDFSFAEAVKKYGENNISIWMYQNYYSKSSSMEFILNYIDLFDITDYTDCSDLEIGLLFASGAHAKLQVAEIPQFLDWRIHMEYDGLEQIKVD